MKAYQFSSKVSGNLEGAVSPPYHDTGIMADMVWGIRTNTGEASLMISSSTCPLLKRIETLHPDLQIPEFETGLKSMTSRRADVFENFEAVRPQLLEFKRTLQAAYITADETGLPVETIGRYWSDFADWCLETACQWAWQSPKIRRSWKPLPVVGPVPGVFILGLGKLGGRDLNFSSDVDLITFYAPERMPTLPFEGKTDVAANLMRTLIKLIDGEKSEGQFVWRTDFRLRPDPSVTDLAMSDQAGLGYFFFNASPWRRLAMMKARVVAGDTHAGENFLAELEPFIWRRHLDYTAIDEIASIKQRIHAEHPGLRGERIEVEPLEQAEGFNVKLGRGGIREIEFIVNACQLLWGGRDKSLRTSHTMTALGAMQTGGYMEKEDCEILKEAYFFFRRLENRLQYYDDRHTHFVPSSQKEDAVLQEWLVHQYQLPDWQALDREILWRRKEVNQRFQQLFAEQEKSLHGVPDRVGPDDLPKTLDKPTAQICKDWLNGFRRYGHYQQIPGELLDLGPRLLKLVLNLPNPSMAIRKLDRLFRSLGIATPYLRLLAEHKDLLKNSIIPFLYAEAMTILLEQSPHVLDGLISNNGQISDDFDEKSGETMVFAPRSYENRLESLRSWTNEHLYLAYLNVFNDEMAPQSMEKYLTLLAEQAVTLAAGIVAADSHLEDLPFTILALGKLGMKRMTPMSDLDLVFICDDGGVELDEANRLARKLQTALNARMREGRVYEIDMRLRPSGRSGPPTVSVVSFAGHHLEGRARTWEQLALVPARAIYGRPQARTEIKNMVARISSRPRNRQQLIDDSYKMLTRLRKERIHDDCEGSLEIKLRPGGLMETEYLISFLCLLYAGQSSRLATTDFDDLCPELARLDPNLEGLAEALRFWRDSLFYRRLIGEETLMAFRTGQGKLPDFLAHKKSVAHFGDNFETLAAKHALYIRQQIKIYIEDETSITPEKLETYREQPVRWEAP